MSRIAVIRRRLLAYADGVHSHKTGMYDSRKKRRKRRGDEHHSLYKHDEHGKDCNNDIETGDTGRLAISRLIFYRDAMYLQLIPRGRSGYRSMVRIRVEYLDWIAIPAMICAFLPELGPVEIWIRDTEQSEG